MLMAPIQASLRALGSISGSLSELVGGDPGEIGEDVPVVRFVGVRE